MEAIEAILTRRSIRKYVKKPIPEKQIEDLIKAAVYAPSAGNEQPWQFAIIEDKKMFEKIQLFHPHAQMLTFADKAILVCGDLQREKHKGYWMIDCSAATQNILLAAHAKGIGAVWLGIYPRQERIDGMKQLLTIPDYIVPFALISLGYPNEEKKCTDRFQYERIHYNTW